MHLGCVKFGISGPLRYTFDASDAVRAGQAFSDALIVPVHYEGWTHFTQGRAEFEAAFGDDPLGKAKRADQGEAGRFRCYTREQIRKDRNDNLDVAWLRDEEDEAEDRLTEPEDIAAAIIVHLRTALEEIEALSEELEPEEQAAVVEAAE